ncbi:putative secreted protein (type I secretion substrate) [Aliiruegeria haliotis]|uniref:Putative secreted protein (Type I secretion substrate) n=1 Tax=Aliiruegeria haliotis TaxID=1280846 RepID=A0A2T0RST4_9RHOB|nr:calcium-binding protein [Aliiruegeria haliotis]PRY24256.1 putative secreted protein (type I secretion substrate) [Aliiruegeria haliotis]
MQLSQIQNEVLAGSVGFSPVGHEPDIATLANGDLIVVWSELLERPTSKHDDVDSAVFARLFSDTGSPLGDSFQVNTWQPFRQDAPQVAALEDGGWSIAWTQSAQYGDNPFDVDVFMYSYFLDGSQRTSGSIDLYPDGPSESADGSGFVEWPQDPAEQLHELVSISNNRLVVVLGSGQVNVISPSGYRLESFAAATLTDYVDTDIAQLPNGDIVRASANGDSVIQLVLTDTSFDAPSVRKGIYGPLNLSLKGTKGEDFAKYQVEVAPLKDGHFAVAYTEQIDKENIRVLVDVLSNYGAFEYHAGEYTYRNNQIDRDGKVDSTSDTLDMIGLANGGAALAVDKTNAIDLYLLDANGEIADQVTVGRSSGPKSAPSLTETDDGRIAIAFHDASGRAIRGDTDTVHVAFYDVEGGNIKLTGTSAGDKLRGQGGNDKLFGFAGDDVLRGGKGYDLLVGGKGNDKLVGGLQNDTLRGGEGNDALFGQAGDDGLNGQDGNDILKGGSGADSISGEDGNDRLSGGQGVDKLFGGQGNDKLGGGRDNDVLLGGRGDDVLKASLGDDLLRGGGGTDRLLGGAGSDIFVFAGSFGTDTITDFSVSDGDVIRMLSGNGEAHSLTAFKNAARNESGSVTYDLDNDGLNVIILEGITMGELTAGSFDFT